MMYRPSSLTLILSTLVVMLAFLAGGLLVFSTTLHEERERLVLTARDLGPFSRSAVIESIDVEARTFVVALSNKDDTASTRVLFEVPDIAPFIVWSPVQDESGIITDMRRVSELTLESLLPEQALYLVFHIRPDGVPEVVRGFILDPML